MSTILFDYSIFLSNNGKHMIKGWAQQKGFTIVELLIVIVVIGILAAIVIVAYQGVQAKAQQAKMDHDIVELVKAISVARTSSSKTLMQVTGNGFTAGSCSSKPTGTDLAALPRTDACWVKYMSALQAISDASSINVTGIVDPWGRPYFIDENEGEAGGCSTDRLGTFSMPFVTNNVTNSPYGNVPRSGYSGCAL
jgi:prepilin-type N-terminal cleavage/methylation domain-containing protein